MAIGLTKLGNLEVSRFILGGNPQSGFSHINEEMDREMMHYFRVDQIKALFRQAEELGITTHIGRADNHIIRTLMEYWDEGGKIQWIAQTCWELGTPQRGAMNGIKNGAKAAFIHGGQMDYAFANNELEEIQPVMDMLHEAGLAAGIAGHNPKVFEWAEEHLECDFYMCCYYNPQPRDKQAEHVRGAREWFDDIDREIMTELIQQLSRPVIHYKIMACSRNEPVAAIRYATSKMRPQDAVCVGIYPKDKPDMLEEDVRLFLEAG